MREPKRIMPNRSPRATAWPTFAHATMRRAMAPGDLAHDDRAVVVFDGPDAAFVEPGGVGMPGVEHLAHAAFGVGHGPGDRGAVGVHVEDGKKDGDALHGRLDDLGSSTSSMPTITPSAAATTAPRSVGTARSGSRKK